MSQGLDETTNALLQRIHGITKNSQTEVIVEIRDEILRRYNELTGLTTAFLEFVKSKGVSRKGSAWRLFEERAKEEEKRLEGKKAREARRLANLCAISMKWHPEVVKYYGFGIWKQSKAQSLFVCFQRWPDFVDFVDAANLVLFLRHCNALRRPNPLQKNLVKRPVQFKHDDLEHISKISKTPRTVYGTSITTASIAERKRDIEGWTTATDGSMVVQGHRLDFWQPVHFAEYLLGRDMHGLVMQRDPNATRPTPTPRDSGVMTPPTSVQPPGHRPVEEVAGSAGDENADERDPSVPDDSSDQEIQVATTRGAPTREGSLRSDGTQTPSVFWPSDASTVLDSATPKTPTWGKGAVSVREIIVSASSDGGLFIRQDERADELRLEDEDAVVDVVVNEDEPDGDAVDVVDDGIVSGMEGDCVTDDGVFGVADDGETDDGVADDGEMDDGVVDDGVADDGVVDDGVVDRVGEGAGTSNEAMVEGPALVEDVWEDGQGTPLREGTTVATTSICGGTIQTLPSAESRISSVERHATPDADMMDDDDETSSEMDESIFRPHFVDFGTPDTLDSFSACSTLDAECCMESSRSSISSMGSVGAPFDDHWSIHEGSYRSASPVSFVGTTELAPRTTETEPQWFQGIASHAPMVDDVDTGRLARGIEGNDPSARMSAQDRRRSASARGLLDARATSNPRNGAITQSGTSSPACYIRPDPIAIPGPAARLSQWFRKVQKEASTFGASRSCISRWHWLCGARLATASAPWDPHMRGGVTESSDGADLIYCSTQMFIQAAKTDIRFTKPIIIKRSSTDPHLHSIDSLVGGLRECYSGVSVDVHNVHANDRVMMSMAEFLREVQLGQNSITLLNLFDTFRAQEPVMVFLSRFQSLDTAIRRAAGDRLSNGFTNSRHLSRSRIQTDGAFAGPQVGPFGGSYINNIVGTQLCMIVPPTAMAGQWEAFAREGTSWRPRGRQILFTLEEGDVVFIPHSHVYALSAMGPCASTEGPVWDGRDIVGSLRSTRWAAENPACAVVPPLPRFDCVLDELQRLVSLDVGKYAGEEPSQPFLTRFRREVETSKSALAHGYGHGCGCRQPDIDSSIVEVYGRPDDDGRDWMGSEKRRRLW